MVTVYGMSDKLGPVTLGKREEMVFLGREMGEQRNYGDRTADEIDVEVSKIVSDAWETAVQILRENRARLDRLAKRLVEIETLEGDTLQQLLDGQEPAAAF
jgi:cell division protease FtsH